MSIRITVLTMVVLFLSGYAWKNWFHALLGGIVLFAFLQHPSMPRGIAGIPGLNLWNLMMVAIAAAWLHQRGSEPEVDECPQGVKVAFMLFLCVIAVSFFRGFIDPSRFYLGTRMDMTLNNLVNPLKYLLPGFMVFDGCRSRERVLQALAAILLLYLLLALQSVKAMGLHFDLSSGDELSSRAARILGRRTGYSRVDLSMMLAGASWAVIAFSRHYKSLLVKLVLFGSAAVVMLGQAVTGGRTGYVTWGLVGLILCVTRWRKLLPVIPLAVAAVIAFIPAVRDRMFQGFTQQEGSFVERADSAEVTAGRTNIWPYVIEDIIESPMIGYGREAMVRTGLSTWAIDNLGEAFDHPHNAYFEMLMDNGIIGFLCAMPIYFILLWRSLKLFVAKGDVLYEVAGGVALSLLLAQMIASLGSQSFYPSDGVVGMWVALGVALRVSIQKQGKEAGDELFEADQKDEIGLNDDVLPTEPVHS